MIDAGMTDEYGGHAAALEIDAQGRMSAVYPEGREPLAVPEPKAARGAPERPASPRAAPRVARARDVALFFEGTIAVATPYRVCKEP